MLTTLGGLAELERELSRADVNDGRRRAKARGVKMGQPPKRTCHRREEAWRNPGKAVRREPSWQGGLSPHEDDFPFECRGILWSQ